MTWRALGVWLLESAAAGVVLGLGARLAMRVLAWMADAPAAYSRGGSIEIVVFGALVGTPIALGVFVVRQWRRWSFPWVGLSASLLLFAVLAARPSPSARSALAASPLAAWQILLVFGLAFAVFGLWIDLRWRRRWSRTGSALWARS